MSFKLETLVIRDGEKRLVDIGFEFDTSLALVGQSGSGKTLTLKALMGLLPQGLSCEMKYDFVEPLVAGKNLSFVPQNPFTSLSPLTKITHQLFVSKAKQHAMFEQVGLDKALLERYPPELSGGQLQRVILAIALSNDSKLILFDEPTTALDSKNKEAILSLIKELQDRLKFYSIFVTHDLQSAEMVSENVVIMQNGEVVESGKFADVSTKPKSQYTQKLIESTFYNRSFRT